MKDPRPLHPSPFTLHCYFSSDNGPDAPVAPRLRKPHHATQVMPVGEGERGIAQLVCPFDQRLGRGRAIEQREAGVAVQLDVAHGYHFPASLLFVCLRQERPSHETRGT